MRTFQKHEFWIFYAHSRHTNFDRFTHIPETRMLIVLRTFPNIMNFAYLNEHSIETDFLISVTPNQFKRTFWLLFRRFEERQNYGSFYEHSRHFQVSGCSGNHSNAIGIDSAINTTGINRNLGASRLLKVRSMYVNVTVLVDEYPEVFRKHISKYIFPTFVQKLHHILLCI